MSSGDDYGGFGSEDDGYGFSDEDGGSDVDVENQYYSSKGLLEGGDNQAALEGFRAVRAPPPRPHSRPRMAPSPPHAFALPACRSLPFPAALRAGPEVSERGGVGEGASPRRC